MEPKDTKLKKIQAQLKDSKFGPFLKKLYKYRSVAMAVPVVAGSAVLTTFNLAKLPPKVVVNLPAIAESEIILKMVEMDKGTAIIVPMLITAVCLLMMFCSRRQLYPWLVSLFSLALPVFLFIAGMFPG